VISALRVRVWLPRFFREAQFHLGAEVLPDHEERSVVIDPFTIQEAEALIEVIQRDWGDTPGNYRATRSAKARAVSRDKDGRMESSNTPASQHCGRCCKRMRVA
jgi:hypothetical protein